MTNPAILDEIPPQWRQSAIEIGNDDDNVLEGDDPFGFDAGDALIGDGSDALIGFDGDDKLIGKGHSDYLKGGDGSDTLTGDFLPPEPDNQGNLPDEFAFDRDDGNDTITDFEAVCPACTSLAGTPAPGDKIVLLGGTEADIEAVVANVTLLKGGDAELRYGDTFIHLVGFPAGDVHEDLFVLG